MLLLCGCFGQPRVKVPDEFTRPQGLYPLDRVDLRKLKRLIRSGYLAPCYPGKDSAGVENEEECPICFLHYPLLNSSRCCNKRVCTECFLQVQTSAPPNQLSVCPFCKTPGYTAKFVGARTFEEKELERVEEQKVIEARIREREEEVQRDQERANQRVQAQAQQPPPAPAAARAQQQEPSASSRPVAVEAASADGFVFPATAAAQRQAGHTHHTHGGGGHGNGHPNSVSSAASRRQHAQAQAAGAAPGPRPEGAAAAEAQQHSRGNEGQQGWPEQDGPPQRQAMSQRRRRPSGGSAGRRYRLTDYVPAGVVDIALGLDDINDLMLEQAMYDSLAANAAADAAQRQPPPGGNAAASSQPRGRHSRTGSGAPATRGESAAAASSSARQTASAAAGAAAASGAYPAAAAAAAGMRPVAGPSGAPASGRPANSGAAVLGDAEELPEHVRTALRRIDGVDMPAPSASTAAVAASPRSRDDDDDPFARQDDEQLISRRRTGAAAASTAVAAPPAASLKPSSSAAAAAGASPVASPDASSSEKERPAARAAGAAPGAQAASASGTEVSGHERPQQLQPGDVGNGQHAVAAGGVGLACTGAAFVIGAGHAPSAAKPGDGSSDSAATSSAEGAGTSDLAGDRAPSAAPPAAAPASPPGEVWGRTSSADGGEPPERGTPNSLLSRPASPGERSSAATTAATTPYWRAAGDAGGGPSASHLSNPLFDLSSANSSTSCATVAPVAAGAAGQGPWTGAASAVQQQLLMRLADVRSPSALPAGGGGGAAAAAAAEESAGTSSGSPPTAAPPEDQQARPQQQGQEAQCALDAVPKLRLSAGGGTTAARQADAGVSPTFSTPTLELPSAATAAPGADGPAQRPAASALAALEVPSPDVAVDHSTIALLSPAPTTTPPSPPSPRLGLLHGAAAAAEAANAPWSTGPQAPAAAAKAEGGADGTTQVPLHTLGEQLLQMQAPLGTAGGGNVSDVALYMVLAAAPQLVVGHVGGLCAQQQQQQHGGRAHGPDGHLPLLVEQPDGSVAVMVPPQQQGQRRPAAAAAGERRLQAEEQEMLDAAYGDYDLGEPDLGPDILLPPLDPRTGDDVTGGASGIVAGGSAGLGPFGRAGAEGDDEDYVSRAVRSDRQLVAELAADDALVMARIMRGDRPSGR